MQSKYIILYNYLKNALIVEPLPLSEDQKKMANQKK